MKLINNLKNSEKYTKYSILVIILFSIIVLSLASIYHVSGDGCWHIQGSRFIAQNQKFPLFEPLGRDEPFWSPPLYHIIAAAVYGVFNLFGNNASNFAVKLVSPVFGILALIFSFLTIKKLTNSKIAFYSAVFLASIPIFMDYSTLSYVESTLVFFVILSVYFLVNDRIALSGIAAGLAMLAKYNGAFILPVLIWILYKKYDKKRFYRKSAIVVSLSLLIASPWLVRNFLLLGNPVWPFLNFIFSGFQQKSYSSVNFANIINPDLATFTYIGFFGVPDGNPATFSFFKLPYFGFLLAVWLIGTLIFSIPLFYGFFAAKRARNKISPASVFAVWIFSYLILFFLYAANVGLFVSRMLLPAFPAIAAFWAFGCERLANKIGFKRVIALAVLIAAGFVFAEFLKVSIASDEWGKYQKDFEWVKANTRQSDVFIANGQCIPYNIGRTSLYATEENIKNADYIWLNQNFRLDKASILDESALKQIQSKDYREVYNNKETGTAVYSTKQ